MIKSTALAAAVLVFVAGCHYLPRHEQVDPQQYAVSAQPQLSAMSGDIKLALLGFRALDSRQVALDVDHMAIDILAEGPDPDALHGVVIIADAISRNPSEFVKLFELRGGVQLEVPLLPAVDRRSFETQPIGRSGTIIQVVQPCIIRTGVPIRDAKYKIEVIKLPELATTLVRPTLQTRLGATSMEARVVRADLKPMSWRLIAPP